MPTLLSHDARTPRDVPLSRFVNDYTSEPAVGRDPWFDTDDGHVSVDAAREQWSRCRRDAWAQVHIFFLPRAAERYDHLSRLSWPLAWSAAQTTGPVDGEAIRRAVQRDRRSVQQFISRDDAGAAAIADFLAAWLECLDIIKDVAHQLAACPDTRARDAQQVLRRLSSARKYGDGAP